MVLVGHSMGTGEVIRYLGTLRVRSGRQGRAGGRHPAVLAADRDNPEGVPSRVRRDCPGRARRTPACFKGFLDNFYNTDSLRGVRVSDQAWQGSCNHASAPPPLPRGRASALLADGHRADLREIDVPVLVLHGDADQVLPWPRPPGALPGLIRDMRSS